MLYTSARIFCGDFLFHKGSFEVNDKIFGTIYLEENGEAAAGLNHEETVDLGGASVIPGLVEVHSHGNSGRDFSDGDYEGLLVMAAYYARMGITSFAPASMTLPYQKLERAFANAKRLAEEMPEGLSVLRGIHMEGPYFSYGRRGAQNPEYLKYPDIHEFRKLQECCNGLIKIVDVAPELPGAEAFIRAAKEYCTVSAAHTDADYLQARAAFDAGVSHVTHLYNAMPGIHHRNPGVIPAAAENPKVRAELICDGLHVHPAVVRLTFSLFGPERMILVSDSGRCCGMEEGSRFELGGQEAWLQNGAARLADGTLACSAVNLFDCMVNAMRFGIAEEDAVRASSYNPACAIGAEASVGSIEPGKRADFIVCRDNYTKRQVFTAGRPIE